MFSQKIPGLPYSKIPFKEQKRVSKVWYAIRAKSHIFLPIRAVYCGSSDDSSAEGESCVNSVGASFRHLITVPRPTPNRPFS